MLRVLLDTNIYGLLASSEADLVSEIVASQKIVVYGCSVVRKELRETPSSKMVGSKKLRMQMLNVYDLLVGKHDIPVSGLAEYLANAYLEAYSGSTARDSLKNDFFVVAISSLKGLDIVCTEDSKTMASAEARRSFAKINDDNGLRTPNFIGLPELKSLL